MLVLHMVCDICGDKTPEVECRDKAPRGALARVARGWRRFEFTRDRGMEDICPRCRKNAARFIEHANQRVRRQINTGAPAIAGTVDARSLDPSSGPPGDPDTSDDSRD